MSENGDQRQPDELTALVRKLANGREAAGVTLLPQLLRELRAIAQGYLRSQRAGHTLQASALVNEAYLKLFGPKGDTRQRQGLAPTDRKHFLALAAQAMRQVLVDHARRRASRKRGGNQPSISLSLDAAPGESGVDFDALDLHLALEDLAVLDERQAHIVELRFFGGLEETDVAELLGVSRTTVQREWRMARAWLGTRLDEGNGP